MTVDNLGDDRVDLHPLDPDRDRGAEERFVSVVMSRIGRTGAAPMIPQDPFFGLWSMPRPILIAASFIVFAMLGAAVGARRAREAAPATIADATGVPSLFLATGARRP